MSPSAESCYLSVGGVIFAKGAFVEEGYQVYAHFNRINGKCYVGATKNTWRERWRTRYAHNPHFYQEIKEYGEDVWEHIILAEGLTREEAAAVEREFIKLLRSNDVRQGYNLYNGGSGIRREHEHIPHDDATIIKISLSMREKWKDPAFRAAQTKPRQSRTDAQKEAARQSMGEQYGRPIKCVETGEVYPSSAAAARAIGVDPKQFKKARRTQNTAYGFHWEFVGEPKPVSRRVICVETGTIYNSVTEAATQTGISKTGISNACTGRRKTASGYHWQYADDV